MKSMQCATFSLRGWQLQRQKNLRNLLCYLFICCRLTACHTLAVCGPKKKEFMSGGSNTSQPSSVLSRYTTTTYAEELGWGGGGGRGCQLIPTTKLIRKTNHRICSFSCHVVGVQHIAELTTFTSSPQILFQIYFACCLYLIPVGKGEGVQPAKALWKIISTYKQVKISLKGGKVDNKYLSKKFCRLQYQKLC